MAHRIMAILISVVAVTLMVSAMCSLFEAVLYSARMGALEMAKAGDDENMTQRAAQMLQMKKHVAAPISAILILNTVANTAGATLSGMYCHKVLGDQYILIFSIGLTLGILFISEIIPKTFGAVHWRGLWPYTVRPILVMRCILGPAIWLIHQLTRFITSGQTTSSATEEEILALMNVSEREGEITAEENAMVQSIINLEDKLAQDVMTPRTVMSTLDSMTTLEDAIPTAANAAFSRFPIYKDEREEIIGYILTRDLYAAAIRNKKQAVVALAKDIEFVPETANCLTLLNTFLKHRHHIAIVTDEYGGLAGLITLEDLIETALGSEIVDETDRATDLQALARRRKERTKKDTEPPALYVRKKPSGHGSMEPDAGTP